MRVHDALRTAAERLRDTGVPSPDHDAEALLAELLGCPRTHLRLAAALSVDQTEAYDRLVARRATREPLQHIVGRAAFRHVEVAVGPGVFVPRPETESLAGWAIDALTRLQCEAGRPPVAVDLCTGSGAVALSLSGEVPGARVHAVEVSETAYEFAKRNLAGSQVSLHLGDIAEALGELDGQVDVVVANPPYVPLTAFETMDPEARDFDPPLALWSGPDGLEAIRTVEAVAARLLRASGQVGCEHADVQQHSAPAVFNAARRWSDVRDHTDLLGKPRYVTARRLSRRSAGTMSA